jgi:hypothetical protein
MTTAEAREKLTRHGMDPDQAADVVDVLEVWGQERAVGKDYLDARLAELKAESAEGIGDLKTEIANLKSELLKEIGTVKTDLGNAKSDLTRWVVTVGFLVQGLLGAGTVAAVKYVVDHPQKATTSQTTDR